MSMDMTNYEELKKFFEEAFGDIHMSPELLHQETITPERPPEWLCTFAEFNPPQVSEEEMKKALIRMSIVDCSGLNRNRRIYNKESIVNAWKEWFNETKRLG